MAWSRLEVWWQDELADDPAYDEIITPMILDMLAPEPGSLYLDIGCGEGRVMRETELSGARVVGVDLNEGLARMAGAAAVCELPTIPLRDDSVDGAYVVLVLEHIEDVRGLLEEAARVVKSGGVLAIVINHPYWSAPGSTPIQDDDGEDLWRLGAYFDPGYSEIAIRDEVVRFHHRSMGELLTTAADAGWSLQRMEEHAHHDYTSQADVPRLLACRWRLLP